MAKTKRGAVIPTYTHMESVFVSVSPTVELDYIGRGAFPELCNAIERKSSGASTHILSQDDAQILMEDAIARRDVLTKGPRNAYNAHAEKIGAAIEEAKNRRAIYEAPKAVCLTKGAYWHKWRGTKKQLIEALGLVIGGPWPGESGGKRWTKVRDASGRAVKVTPYWRYCDGWPALFEASVEIPESERPESKVTATERAEKLMHARMNLDHVPKNIEDFLWDRVDSVRRMVGVCITSQPSDFHGFSFTEESVVEILMSLDEVADAIMNAEVHFDVKRQRKVLLKYQAQIAELDTSFQQKLATLTKRNPALLERNPS